MLMPYATEKFDQLLVGLRLALSPQPHSPFPTVDAKMLLWMGNGSRRLRSESISCFVLP